MNINGTNTLACLCYITPPGEEKVSDKPVTINPLPHMYVIKDLVPGIMIVFGGLLGLFLDPGAPPLVGGRCSLMIVAMLLVVNMSRGAKRYPYFTCTDAVACVQLAMLLLGLFKD